MKVDIKQIDSTLPLPEYQTAGSVGFDLYARINTIVPKKEIALIPGNVIIKTPPGYMLAVVSRSSTPKRKGLLSPHGFGVIDTDYCGESDEIGVLVYNFTDRDVEVLRGERIAQGVFIKVETAEFIQKSKMAEKSRGGFGSTGKV